MGSQLHKQTRNDTSVWKQIVASILSAQQIHGNAADITKGQERTLKPAFFYANDRHLVPNKLIVRYRVLGGVYPLTSCIVSPQFVACKDVAIIVIPKKYCLSTWSQDLDFQDPGFLFSPEELSRYCLCKHWICLCKFAFRHCLCKLQVCLRVL